MLGITSRRWDKASRPSFASGFFSGWSGNLCCAVSLNFGGFFGISCRRGGRNYSRPSLIACGGRAWYLLLCAVGWSRWWILLGLPTLGFFFREFEKSWAGILVVGWWEATTTNTLLPLLVGGRGRGSSVAVGGRPGISWGWTAGFLVVLSVAGCWRGGSGCLPFCGLLCGGTVSSAGRRFGTSIVGSSPMPLALVVEEARLRCAGAWRKMLDRELCSVV